MNLYLTDDQKMLQDTFSKLFVNESTPEHIKAAEPLGHDPMLWQKLVEVGVPLMRVPEESDGAGLSLLDAAILVEQAGRNLASAPVIETMIAGRLLAASTHDTAADWFARLCEGSAIVSIALTNIDEAAEQLVAAGAVADAVLCLDGDKLTLVTGGEHPHLDNLGASAIARWQLNGDSTTERVVIDSGESAKNIFEGAVEEWKLLTAVALAGLGKRAMEMAAEYTNERKAFGNLIGSYQGLAHPMADSATEIHGAMYLAWRAIWAISCGHDDAAATVSMAYWWSTQATSTAVAKALHAFGGYGLSLEYAVQLYHRRGKAWPLVYGDPSIELQRIADRLWGDARPALPPAGDIPVDFSLGKDAEAFGQTAKRFFQENLTDELKAHAHHSWEGHHPEFQKALAKAGLLLPDWPEQYGGQGRNRYDMMAIAKVFHDVGWTRNAIAVTDMVGHAILGFGSDHAKDEILPRLTSGNDICCLGYTEPSCGSDVFAAQTKAVKDGDDWVINGSKMFTSGANIADYVLLLTRTNPDVAKHAGLTMFIVPMNTPGIEVQAVYTLADERTNITYYDNVRIADSYRIGEVDGGVMVMAAALSDEQTGSSYDWSHRSMIEKTVEWAKSTHRGGKKAIDHDTIRERLAAMMARSYVSNTLNDLSLWNSAEKLKDRSIGPMSKLFSTETYIKDSASLMEMKAPDSLLAGDSAIHHVEVDYRLSTATSIYAGSSEIMRSMVAENYLKMPRTRN